MSQIFSLSAVFPVLTKSRVEVGVESIIYRNAEDIPDPLPPEYIDDFVGKKYLQPNIQTEFSIKDTA